MDEMNTVGTLYIVATPIGNARDMTERGRQILETADIIAAEDTRRSVVLLNKLGIRGNQLSANHKFNEYGKAKWFIEQLASGKDIAVITDAGTPCISDPGNELIRAAIDAGIRVVGVPGCCAAVTALSISGFDLSTFFFFGFFGFFKSGVAGSKQQVIPCYNLLDVVVIHALLVVVGQHLCHKCIKGIRGGILLCIECLALVLLIHRGQHLCQRHFFAVGVDGNIAKRHNLVAGVCRNALLFAEAFNNNHILAIRHQFVESWLA